MLNRFRLPRLPWLCAAWLASCAPLGPKIEILPPTDAPASQPASAQFSELDFTPIPAGSVVPTDGIFVTLDGANALVYANRRRDHEHKLQLLDLEERAALAESRAKGAERRAAETDTWWTRNGLLIGFGGGVLLTAGGFVAALFALHSR